MAERIISEKEEQVIRLVHHDFAGLKPKAAAVKMGIPVRKVYSYLAAIKHKAPKLFPILTAEQFTIYKLAVYENLSYGEIAEEMNCTTERVNKIIVQLHEKGFSTDRPKIQRYDGSMDSKVVRKF